MKSIYKIRLAIGLMLFILLNLSCKKLVDVDPPITETTAITAFALDATAISTMTGIYATLSTSGTANNFSCGGGGVSYLAGLSADEFNLLSGINSGEAFNYFKNSLSANNSTAYGYEFWNSIYVYVYRINSIIEGLNASTSLTPAVKQQLLGEAYFMRSFCYFYLVNLYGDVPLILTSNYSVNASFARTPKTQVYAQMVADLKTAQGLLSNNYLDATLLKTTTEKVRPTQWAATALLARVYLFTGNN